MQTPFLTGVLLSALLAPAALAQGFTEDWEFDGRAQLVVVASTVDDVERLPSRNLLGEVSVRATAKKTLENSAQIGFRFEAKAQQDNPARAGFTGNIEPYVSLIPAPPAASSLVLRGAFSGLTRIGPVEEAGPNGAVETAHVYIDGGYGQLSAGLGRGVAVRFHEGAPDIFTHARAANPKLDPAGFNIVRTENDLTGPSAKITYQTPRILGVRAGLSYTPDVNTAGLDRDAIRSVPGVLMPEIKNVFEGSLQISRKLTEQNLRIRASASYATGEVSIRNSALTVDDVEVWNSGVELEFENLSIGAEYLFSNNGYARGGDYSAWSVGATTEAFDWEWGIRYGQSEDQSVAAEGQNWSIGGATKISQKLRVALGYQANDIDFDPISIGHAQSRDVPAPKGVVVEVTLSL